MTPPAAAWSPCGKWLAAILGIATLALASRIGISMRPVPITLQTLAVTLIGALYGWRLGVATVLAWLLLGAFGLPVFSAGGTQGTARLLGPAGGYLLAFPVAAGLVGALAERGWNTPLWRAFVLMSLGNATCLLLGAAWLALASGEGKAFVAGMLPYLPGALLKSAAGALVVYAVARKLAGLRRDGE